MGTDHPGAGANEEEGGIDDAELVGGNEEGTGLVGEDLNVGDDLVGGELGKGQAGEGGDGGDDRETHGDGSKDGEKDGE